MLTLHGTPLSHFTRKVRIVLAELGVPFELAWTPGLLGVGAEVYAEHPLLRVPTLVHDDITLIESDHIARWLVGRYDPGDRLRVRTEDPADLNRLAVANGIMANEVTLLLVQRGGFGDLDGVAYFRKLATAIERGLAWLDARTDPDEPDFDYVDVATICVWQHVVHWKMAPQLERYERIASRVARFADRPSVATTTPAASLAAAAR
jgi:glutathione S-transferase